MGSFSDYLENAILDQLFNKSALAEVTIFIALSTEDPSDSGANLTEPTAASYGRQDTSAATWGAAADGSLANDVAIEFTTAVQSWCTVTHFGAYDASTAGNCLFWGQLTASRDITTNDSCRFAAGSLVVALD